jgi:hypothetical protein
MSLPACSQVLSRTPRPILEDVPTGSLPDGFGAELAAAWQDPRTRWPAPDAAGVGPAHQTELDPGPITGGAGTLVASQPPAHQRPPTAPSLVASHPSDRGPQVAPATQPLDVEGHVVAVAQTLAGLSPVLAGCVPVAAVQACSKAGLGISNTPGGWEG